MARTLKDLDGMSLTSGDLARQFDPMDILRWRNAGFIRVDLDTDCFRLTAAGESAAESLAAQPSRDWIA